MRLSPIGLGESFDATSPVVVRVALGRRADGSRSWRDALPSVASWCLPFLVVLWLIGVLYARAHNLEPGAGEPLALAADVSNYLLLMTAFGAPAAGVGARFRIDRSPVLGDLLMSGFGWRRLAAAMHGRIVLGGVFALLLAGIVAGALAWVIVDPVQSASDAVNSSRLALVTGYVPVLRPGRELSPPALVAALAMMAAMAVNFGAGFHARASLTAAIGAVGPGPVALTTVLVVLAMASFVARWGGPTACAGWIGVAIPDAVLFWIHTAIEVACAAFRMGVAFGAWRHILRVGEDESRARLGWD